MPVAREPTVHLAAKSMFYQPYSGFIAAAMLLLILPGPTNALLMAAGTERGPKAALRLIGAEIIAYGLAITPLLVFSELLGAWRQVAGMTLKSVAIGIILLLAWRLWRHAGKSAGRALVSAKSIFWVTLFNPKSLVFAFAIFPPVNGAGDLGIKVGLAALSAMACGFVWIIAGAVLAESGLRNGTLIGRLSTMILVGFAIYLGTSIATDAAAMVR